MERRLVTFKPMGNEVPNICCLKHIQKNNMIFPGQSLICPRCDTFLKSCWLDFNKSRMYGAIEGLYEKKYNIEDFIPLSAMVLSRYGDSSKELQKKFVVLFDNVEVSSLKQCEVVDSESGREYVFNRDVVVEESRILRFGDDVFVIIGKVSKEEKEKIESIKGIVFTNNLVFNGK